MSGARGLGGNCGTKPKKKEENNDADHKDQMMDKLPPGWSCRWSRTRQKLYYCNQELGVSQWTKPSSEDELEILAVLNEMKPVNKARNSMIRNAKERLKEREKLQQTEATKMVPSGTKRRNNSKSTSTYKIAKEKDSSQGTFIDSFSVFLGQDKGKVTKVIVPRKPQVTSDPKSANDHAISDKKLENKTGRSKDKSKSSKLGAAGEKVKFVIPKLKSVSALSTITKDDLLKNDVSESSRKQKRSWKPTVPISKSTSLSKAFGDDDAEEEDICESHQKPKRAWKPVISVSKSKHLFVPRTVHKSREDIPESDKKEKKVWKSAVSKSESTSVSKAFTDEDLSLDDVSESSLKRRKTWKSKEDSYLENNSKRRHSDMLCVQKTPMLKSHDLKSHNQESHDLTSHDLKSHDLTSHDQEEDMDYETSPEEIAKLMTEINEIRVNFNDGSDMQVSGQLTARFMETGSGRTSPAVTDISNDKALFVVVDTNVLLNSLQFVKTVTSIVLTGFQTPILIIPWIVMTEIDLIKDNKKHLVTQKTQQKARSAVRYLNDNLEAKHPGIQGQKPYEAAKKYDQLGEVNNNDDKVLQCCVQSMEKYPMSEVFLLTGDTHLRNKAIILEIPAYKEQTLDKWLKEHRTIRSASESCTAVKQTIQRGASPIPQRPSIPLSGLNQSQARLNQSCDGLDQSQYVINKSCAGFSQSQARLNQSCDGLNQSQSVINKSCTGFNQSQARLNQSCDGLDQSQSVFNESCAGFDRSQTEKPFSFTETLPSIAHHSVSGTNDFSQSHKLPTLLNRSNRSNVQTFFQSCSSPIQEMDSEAITPPLMPMPQSYETSSSHMFSQNQTEFSPNISSTVCASQDSNAQHDAIVNFMLLNKQENQGNTSRNKLVPCLTHAEKKCSSTAPFQEIRVIIQDELKACLGRILEHNMTEVYGEIWKTIVYRKPPWSLTDILVSFKKHWIAVFGNLFGRNNENQLEQFIKFVNGHLAQTYQELRMFADNAISLCDAFNQYFGDKGVEGTILSLRQIQILLLEAMTNNMSATQVTSRLNQRHMTNMSAAQVTSRLNQRHMTNMSATQVTSRLNQGQSEIDPDQFVMVVQQAFQDIWEKIVNISMELKPGLCNQQVLDRGQLVLEFGRFCGLVAAIHNRYSALMSLISVHGNMEVFSALEESLRCFAMHYGMVEWIALSAKQLEKFSQTDERRIILRNGFLQLESLLATISGYNSYLTADECQVIQAAINTSSG